MSWRVSYQETQDFPQEGANSCEVEAGPQLCLSADASPPVCSDGRWHLIWHLISGRSQKPQSPLSSLFFKHLVFFSKIVEGGWKRVAAAATTNTVFTVEAPVPVHPCRLYPYSAGVCPSWGIEGAKALSRLQGPCTSLLGTVTSSLELRSRPIWRT